MPFEMNEKLKSLEPYEPITGEYRIRLDANESFIPPSEELMQDILAAVSSLRFNRYPDSAARDLCEKAAAYYGVPAACITAGNGSDDLIAVIMNAFTQKGDTVLTFTPDFSMYAFYSALIECPCVQMPKRADATIDVDAAIARANEDNARLILFSNPCNPTSVGLAPEEVVRLIRGVSSLVVLDEAYMDFYGQSLVERVEEFDNLIILRTLSKAMGMAGIRLGFAAACPVLTDKIRAAKSPYNVNAVTQAIGCAVFSHPDHIRHSISRILSSRDALFEQIKQLAAAVPDKLRPVAADANFVYTRADNAAGVFEYLKANGIIIRRFGDYLRITAGRNLENLEVVKAMEEYYKTER